jgi:hypothetical protein
MVVIILYRYGKYSLVCREVEPQTHQWGASAAGHTPLERLSSVPTPPMAEQEAQGLWGLSASTELDRAIVST